MKGTLVFQLDVKVDSETEDIRVIRARLFELLKGTAVYGSNTLEIVAVKGGELKRKKT